MKDTPCEDVDVSNWIIMSVTPNIIENITGNQVIKATFDKISRQRWKTL